VFLPHPDTKNAQTTTRRRQTRPKAASV
jgi:hypothetical protein